VTTAGGEGDRSRDDLVEERRKAILDAAEQLLAVHGFDALRLRDVAKAAGVSIGMIQHYFTTRDELLHETMRVASERRARTWIQLASGQERARDKVAALIEGSINDRHRCVIWIETCAASTRHPALLADVHRTQKAWQQTLRDAIEEGITRRDFRAAIPVGEIVDVLVSLIDGLMLASAVDTAESDGMQYRVQLLRQATQRLLRADEE
jgi:TetR/AcrR family transcriptional repressor of bet genes